MRLVVAVLAATLSWGAVSRAEPFTPPTMTAAGGTQKGSPVFATSYKPSGANSCVMHHADFPGTFPAAIPHSGPAVTWRLPDARKPAEVSVILRRVGTGQAGLAPAEDVPVTLVPVRSGRRVVAWTVRSADVGYGDLHLDLTVTWPKGRCGGSDAGRYRYRLRSLPQPVGAG